MNIKNTLVLVLALLIREDVISREQADRMLVDADTAFSGQQVPEHLYQVIERLEEK